MKVIRHEDPNDAPDRAFLGTWAWERGKTPASRCPVCEAPANTPCGWHSDCRSTDPHIMDLVDLALGRQANWDDRDEPGDQFILDDPDSRPRRQWHDQESFVESEPYKNLDYEPEDEQEPF